MACSKTWLAKVYRALEDVSFPEDEVVHLLRGLDGEEQGEGQPSEGNLASFLHELAKSLQVPFGSLWLGLIALSGFESHRTVAQYTPMLHSPGFPYLGNMGRSGDGKSKVVWLLKQIVKEREKRDTNLKVTYTRDADDGQEGIDDTTIDHDSAGERPKKKTKVATPHPTKWIWDTGSLHGAAQVMSANGERCMALLHEGKKVMKDILADAPGSRADSFVKLYDRDDYTNSVLNTSSFFQNDFPCFVLYMALHLEDFFSLFGGEAEDPAGVRWRVDWFYLPGTVPMLKDFGSLEQDVTIEFLADVCELIDDQYPVLKEKDARKQPGYSRRLNVWRLPQKGPQFSEHFEAHAFQQGRAKDELQDDKLASFHSKMTTKVCRYAPPIDHLLKGWTLAQKLKKWKAEKLARMTEGDTKEDLSFMTLPEVRKKIMKEEPQVASAMGLKQWPLETTDTAVNLAKLTLDFLSAQAGVLEKYLRETSADASRVQGESPAMNAANSCGIIENDDDLKQAVLECDVEKITVSAGVLLGYKAGVFKVASVRSGLYHGKDTKVALSLLQKLSLMKFVMYKPSNVGGTAARYAIKRPLPPGEGHVAQNMAVLNLVKTLFNVMPSAYHCQGTDVGVAPLPEDLALFPPLTVEGLAEISKPWISLLTTMRTEGQGRPSASGGDQHGTATHDKRNAARQGPEASQSVLDAVVGPLDLAPLPAQGNAEPIPPTDARGSTTTGSPEPSQQVPWNRVPGLKVAMSWVLGASDQAELKRPYVVNKAKGLDGRKDADDFEVIANALQAMGLGSLNKGRRVDSTGEIHLRAPPAGAVRTRVVQALVEWFEAGPEFSNKLQRKFDEKCKVNPDFDEQAFQSVLEYIKHIKSV